MRQISLYRPNEKLRGAKRRIKALEEWVLSAKNYFPNNNAEDKYWHQKIPVLDRLVEPPTTTKVIQTKCANLMLQAASYISLAKPKKTTGFSLVTVILDIPYMHSSEICVFFDEEYLIKIFSRNNSYEKITRLNNCFQITGLNIIIPDAFDYIGFQYKNFDEEYPFESQWWLFYEKSMQSHIANLVNKMEESNMSL
jgi:hypothetical protein